MSDQNTDIKIICLFPFYIYKNSLHFFSRSWPAFLPSSSSHGFWLLHGFLTSSSKGEGDWLRDTGCVEERKETRARESQSLQQLC